MAIYRMYFDETGSPRYRGTGRSEDRYMSLTGVVVTREYHHKTLYPALENLKRRHFDYDEDDPPILHREDIVARRGVFGCLRDAERNKQWCLDLKGFLQEHDYRLITIVIDKDFQRERWGDRAWGAYFFSLKALLQRYIMFLGRYHRGDVMAEGRGKTENREIAAQYESFYRVGDDHIQASEVQAKFTTSKLKIKTKEANIAGLQIADILACDLRREILHEKAGLDEPGGFSKHVCEAVTYKHHTSWRGALWGVGKVWLGPGGS